MCGIAGFVTSGDAPDRALLKAMCDRIRHRGPDEVGSFVDSRAALGHQRLSIIDLSSGQQPMGNEDGNLQVIFNGEIYNYPELREELEAKGHRFATRSDTEVLVHMYEELGERMPERLNGMFALAIWDRRKQELFLARDRFGKKPLYYTTKAPGIAIAFASELKSITAIPGFEAEADPRAVADFLAFGYVPDPRAICRNAAKLPPGHTLLWRRGEARERRYWRLEFSPEPEPLEKSAERIHELAVDAVKRRLMSEVPLGAFLSGGVDSSAVVGMMSVHGGIDVKSFSIGFTNKEVDEIEYARLLVDRYKTDHREKIVTPQIHEMLDTLVNHYDEPFGDPSAIPTLYLCRMTREHVTVALSGDGADEVFGGYDRYQLGVLEDRIRRAIPGPVRRTVVAAAARHWPRTDYLPRPLRWKSMLGCVSADIAGGYYQSVTAFRGELLNSVLADSLKRSLNGYSPEDAFRDHFRGLEKLPALAQLQAVDICTYLPGDILVKVDRASMAYSLEARAPWLDYRLAEAAARLTDESKISGTRNKIAFKEAVARYLPERNVKRRKQGFIVPMAEWMRTSLRGPFESTVLRPEMEAYLNLGEARRLWNQHQGGVFDNSTKLWYLFMLACWSARHVDRRDSLTAELATKS